MAARRDTPSVVMSVIDQAMMLQTAARGSASTRCERCTLMLTPREREVLHCIAGALSCGEDVGYRFQNR
jgi:hypothetical protein